MLNLLVKSKFTGDCFGICYLAIIVSVIATLLATASFGSSPLIENAQADLNTHLPLRDAVGSGDYSFEYAPNCQVCDPQPARVTARIGKVDSVTFVHSGDSPEKYMLGLYHTIDGLFDKVQEAIDLEASSLDVSYDPEMGYPTSAEIDYEANTIDEESAFTVTSYSSLEK